MNTSKVQQIKKDIAEIGEVGISFYKNEFDKFIKQLEGKIKELDDELSNVIKELIEAEKQLKEMKDEKKKTEEIVKANKDTISNINAKQKELDKRETNLAELHKILENKRLMLKAKEKDLNTRRIR